MKTVLQHKRSFALVITLLIITLLTFTAVAFFTSSQIERTNSRSAFHLTQAQLAAQAGITIAQETLRHLITQYPDSVTKFEPRLADKPGFPGTALIYKDVLPTNPTSHNIPYRYLPLVSGATSIILSQASARAQAIPEGDFIDLNDPKLNPDRAQDVGGWISGPINLTSLTQGNTTGSQTYANNEIRAPWVNISPTARYAFWIEDESFKFNLNAALEETETHLVRNETRFLSVTRGIAGFKTQKIDGNEIITHAGFPVQLASRLITGEGITENASKKIPIIRKNLIDNQSNKSGLTEFPSQKFIWHHLLKSGDINKNQAINSLNQAKFLTTAHSFSLNTSRIGAPRMNINQIVNPFQDPNQFESNPENIANRINRIIEHIMYNTTGSFQDTNHEYFWGRRYDSSRSYNAYSSASGIRYFKKLAINIYDQIAGWNNMPTAIKNEPVPQLTLNKNNILRTSQDYLNASPVYPPNNNSLNPFGAIGKRQIPYITEFVMHIIQAGNPGSKSNQPGGDFSFKVNYYIEFWNPYTDTPSFKKNPKLIIENTPSWIDVGSGKQILPIGSLDAEINLANIMFQPGINVITNAADSEIPNALVNKQKLKKVNIIFPKNPYPILGNPGKLSTTDSNPPMPKLSINTKSGYAGLPSLQMQTRDSIPSGPNQGKDTQIRLIIKNDDGIISYYPHAITIRPAILIDGHQNNAKLDFNKYHIRGGQFLGNSPTIPQELVLSSFNLAPNIHSGDPRSIFEYEMYRRENGWKMDTLDSTPAPSSLSNSQTPLMNTLSLGKMDTINNISLSDASNKLKMWRDVPTEDSFTNVNFAPFIHRQVNLDSVGQLGHVYDPTKHAASEQIRLYGRGGSRTLNIGQTDGPIDNIDTAYIYDPVARPQSRFYTAWRLVDFFTTTPYLYLPGTYNINGILKDGGKMFKELLKMLQFNNTAQGDPDRQGSMLSAKILDTHANAIYKAIIDYLNPDNINNTALRVTPGAFMERGELSEIKHDGVPLFSSSSNVYAGKNMKIMLDRDRESLLRRLGELICTRGNVFTVYCVGQAITSTPSGSIIPLATSKARVTFALYPVYTNNPALLNYNSKQLTMTATIKDVDNQPAQASRYQAPTDYKIKILSQEYY